MTSLDLPATRAHSRVGAWWPALATSALLVLVSAQYAANIKALNGDGFTYCMDDTYIHMAIARNFVEHGVWGVTSYGFSSSASSPLWILILGAYFKLHGVDVAAPFILNLIFASAAVAVAGFVLHRSGLSPRAAFIVLASLVFLTPFPVLILSGMEHSLQILLVLVFLATLDPLLRGSEPPARARVAALCLTAFLMTICRYESLFLVFSTCLVLLARRQWKVSVLLGICAGLSVAGFGAFFLYQGWHAFPNSVLLKAQRDWHSFGGVVEALGGHLFEQLYEAPHMITLLAFSGAGLWWLVRRGERRLLLQSPAALLVILWVTAVLHLQFAQTGWLYRYEAYLVTSFLLTFTIILSTGVRLPQFTGRARVAATAVLLLGAAPLLYRAGESMPMSLHAAKNIHDQQVQMATFLKEEMGTEPVMLNDIGAASFFSDVHVVDLFGLASNDVANIVLRNGHLEPRDLEELARAHHVGLAIVHPYFLIPSTWKRIGAWGAPPPRVWYDVVTFFVVDPSRRAELKQKFEAFKSRLPADVGVVSYSGDGE